MAFDVIRAVKPSGSGAAEIALGAGRAAPHDRKDMALVTSFVLGFIVILFFAAVLVLTESRETGRSARPRDAALTER